MDLRKEFDKILAEYGFPVILQRTSRKIHCRWVDPVTGKPCWDERAQEGNPKCPICLGSGWVTRVERHMVRRDNASQIVTLPGSTMIAEPGRLWTPANNFYFRHDVHPQVGDLIFEVGWNRNRPVSLIAVHLIQHSEPNRGDRGRIEFYQAATRLVTLDKQYREGIIRSFGAVPTYTLVGGDA